MKRLKNFRENLIKALKDPAEASAYINAAIREGDPKFLLVALSDVAEARGFLAKLHRQLKTGKPLDMSKVENLLTQMGLHLTVVPENKQFKRAA